MTGEDLIDILQKQLIEQRGTKSITQRELASELGITVPTLSKWRSRKVWTPLQVAQLIQKRCNVQRNSVLKSAITPIVEFFALDNTESKKGANWEIFDPATSSYLLGLKDRLAVSCGVYIFYDSRGQVIYAGKTERVKTQKLWAEINNAFNRDRDVQRIKKVDHPIRNIEFKAGEEKQRQIYDRPVQLHELASYLSAYEVADGLIGKVEALLVRGFANDLLNVRMEYFFPKAKRKKRTAEAG